MRYSTSGIVKLNNRTDRFKWAKAGMRKGTRGNYSIIVNAFTHDGPIFIKLTITKSIADKIERIRNDPNYKPNTLRHSETFEL